MASANERDGEVNNLLNDKIDDSDKLSKLGNAGVNDQDVVNIRQSVSAIIYPIFVVLLVIFMLGAVAISGLVVYYVEQELIEPSWMRSSLPAIRKIAQLFNPTDSETSRTLDALFVGITALIMGIFLKRCASKTNKLEIFLVVFFILAGAVQLSLLLIMPAAEIASGTISNGGELTEKLNIILARSANIAIAISFAALGIQITKEGS